MAHPVTHSLASVTDPVQQNRIKVAAFVALPNVVNVVTVGAYTVTLVARPVAAVNGCLQFNVRITKSGVDVTPASMNPVQVWNPPILFSDPAGDVVLADGSCYREDLHAALLAVASGLVQGLG